MLKFLWMDVWMSMCPRPLCRLALWCAWMFQLLHWWWMRKIHDIHVVFKAQILHLGGINTAKYQDKLTCKPCAEFRESTLFQCYVMFCYLKKQSKQLHLTPSNGLHVGAETQKHPRSFPDVKCLSLLFPPIIMEVESGCVWKVSTIGGKHFLLPRSWEEG